MVALLSLVTLAATAFGLVSANPIEARQEALRFGVVNVNPTTVKVNEEFIVTYNSTLARYQPAFVDFYIQGTIVANGFVQPEYLLQRSSYPAGAKTLSFQTTLPAIEPDADKGYTDQAAYSVWAYITFPSPDTGALEVGGTSTGIGIDLS
ncbi:hypothetical protein EW026_g8312 [Hermanssonia centrifuga]|uniref:Uncharacterized protein n=2 Tax=Hermanssonia centrifuga TaxID=98765 RepID=A0A4S4K4K5_9APHY|nr:hypothetical protein PHLCEN_2v2469 [Hermanssonia centrifuga]THG92668.1 hypothetical protein EW026_g8312 [Hermanssonia centrifuga]